MCLDLHSILMLLIWCVVIGVLFAILRLVIPRFGLGDPAGLVLQILSILIWAIVVIAILVLVFDVLSCLLGGGFGLGLRR